MHFADLAEMHAFGFIVGDFKTIFHCHFNILLIHCCIFLSMVMFLEL